jgi:hypothetical protein
MRMLRRNWNGMSADRHCYVDNQRSSDDGEQDDIAIHVLGV